jgi:DNA-binding transcriptional ArsR family regulator
VTSAGEPADPGHPASGQEPGHGLKTLTSIEAVRALNHPLRLRAYIEAVKGPVSAKDLAERLEVPLPRISYHVRLLADVGLLRIVSRTPRRGALETHYRAIATLEVSDDAFAESGSEALVLWAKSNVGLFIDDICHAIEEGAAEDEDCFTLRAHFVVDDAGRKRVTEEVRAFVDRLAALEAELRVESRAGTHPINVVLGQYRGARAAGRNAPMTFNLPEERETIPPD